MKRCPRCDAEKPLEDYHQYFSKGRNKFRVANYCKDCARVVSNINAKKNYREKRVDKLEYAKKYRTENAEKIKEVRPKYKKRQMENLQDCYVRELLVSKSKINPEFIKDNPEILETRRLQIKIKRKLKSLTNGHKK